MSALVELHVVLSYDVSMRGREGKGGGQGRWGWLPHVRHITLLAAMPGLAVDADGSLGCYLAW